MGSEGNRSGSGFSAAGPEHFARVRFSGNPQTAPARTTAPAPENRPAERTAAPVQQAEQGVERRIDGFELPDLHAANQADYGRTRTKYGSFAVTDEDRNAKSRKDSRFMLNSFSRASLSVENEEQRVVEERVRARLGEAESQVREQAFRKGYEDGFRSGMQQAQEQFRQEAKQRSDRFDAFLEACEEAKTRIFAANEQAIAELVLRLGREILLRELKTDREHVARLAQDLVSRFGLRDNIRMEISRQDAENISLIEGRLMKSAGELKNLQIDVSDRVGAGGVLIETDWNVIDASVETQLRGLFEALLDHPVTDAAVHAIPAAAAGSGGEGETGGRAGA